MHYSTSFASRSELSGRKCDIDLAKVEKNERNACLEKLADSRIEKVLTDCGIEVYEQKEHPVFTMPILKSGTETSSFESRIRNNVFVKTQKVSAAQHRTHLEFVCSQYKNVKYLTLTPNNQPFVVDEDLWSMGIDPAEIALNNRSIIKAGSAQASRDFRDCPFSTLIFKGIEMTFVRASCLKTRRTGWFVNVHYNILADFKYSKKYGAWMDKMRKKWKWIRDAGVVRNLQEATKYNTKSNDILELDDRMLKIHLMTVGGSTLFKESPELGRALKMFSFAQTPERKEIMVKREVEGVKPDVDIVKGEPVRCWRKVRQMIEKHGITALISENICVASTAPKNFEISRNDKKVTFQSVPCWIFIGKINKKTLGRRMLNAEGLPSYMCRGLAEQVAACYKNGVPLGDFSDWVAHLIKHSPTLRRVLEGLLDEGGRSLYLGQCAANLTKIEGDNPEIEPPKRSYFVRKRLRQATFC